MTSKTKSDLLKIPIVSIKMLKERHVWFSKQVTTPRSFIELIYPFYKDIDREKFTVVGLDAKNYPTLVNVASIGSIDCAPVSPADIFKPLIMSNSYSFIVCHNHVTGHLEPSQADIDITKNLRELGKMLKIFLIDHIVLGNPDHFYSFANVYFRQ
jgi:DNA repair protein RadC